MTFRLRPATLEDCPALATLIETSARTLGRADYSPAVIEAALGGVWGVDRQLIADGTYAVLETPTQLVACGGWSARATLFGSDDGAHRNPRRLDPRTEAARVRAFFVHPSFARQGLGSRLLRHCEAQAQAAGFRALCLGATAPGRRLYETHGFEVKDTTVVDLPHGLTMVVLEMHKRIAPL